MFYKTYNASLWIYFSFYLFFLETRPTMNKRIQSLNFFTENKIVDTKLERKLTNQIIFYSS